MKQNIQSKPKSNKVNKFAFIFVPVLAVVLFVVGYNFVAMQVELSQKNSELAQLSEQRAEVENNNRLLSRYSKDDYKIEYIENIARDKLGYALPEERIYYIVPAD